MIQKFFAYHIGVQGGLGRQLNGIFRSCRTDLEALGIHAPIAKQYRPYLRDFVWEDDVGLGHQPQALEAFDCPAHYAGITLSNDQALSGRRTLYEKGEFLYWAEDRIEKISRLFADHRIIFLIEVENFATFLPKHLSELETDQLELISAWPLRDFVWSDLIKGIKAACPMAEVIVVPTEVASAKLQTVVAKLTTEAGTVKRVTPPPIARNDIEAFQLAIGNAMADPLKMQVAKHLYEVMGWDHETRVMLSRQYYSEVLELYHECTLVL